MAPPPLRVGTTVDGNRMTITFSQRSCARKYHDYLKTLGDRFDEIQPCENSPPESTVFMSLPPGITITPPSPDDKPNSVTLTFEDKAKAITWEQEMILWKIDGQKEDDATTKTQLSLVSVWKVDEFQSKLGLPKHDSDNEQGIVFGVDVPRVQTPITAPRFSGPDRLVSVTTDPGGLFGLLKRALRSRFG